MERERDILICECNSTEHQVVFHYDGDDEVVYMHIHLTTYHNFFKRLWVGLKYAFGYKCRYGNWDEIILTKKHIPIFKNILLNLNKDVKRKRT